MFNLKVLSFKEEIFNRDVTSIIIPCIDGLKGIMQNHEDMMAILKEGTIQIKYCDEIKEIKIKEGIFNFYQNKAVILI